MGNILTLIKAIENIDIDIMLDKAILDNEEILLKNYQENQLRKGLDKNNNAIGSYNSVSYGIMKQEMNPKANGNVDLKLSGAQDAGMKIISEDEGYRIESSVDYFKDNIKRYGVDWLSFNDEVMQLNKPIILSSMQKQLRDGLRM